MSDTNNTSLDFVLPPDSSSLIRALDRTFPQRPPSTIELATEHGRLMYAQHLGQRELIDMLIRINDRPR